MWNPFRCRLFRDHDYAVRRQPGVMFLECRRCGHKSSGWNLGELRVRRAANTLRLRIAEPWEAAHAITLRPGADTLELIPTTHGPKLRLVLGDFAQSRPSPQSLVPGVPRLANFNYAKEEAI
jgi:hypothetical protein